MSESKKKFSNSVRKKALLWSARHCCLCRKQCGLDIELHHIDPNLDPPELNAIDNAIPVCYECHSKLEFSKFNSPRGSKYSKEEIKDTRDQIYEENTRHLVPIIAYGPTDDLSFPQVRFFMVNTDGKLNVRVRCKVEIFISGRLFGTPKRHYAGKRIWVCNPGLRVKGWFDLSDPAKLIKDPKYEGILPHEASGKKLRLRVHLNIIDAFEREHDRLPVEWFFNWEKQKWIIDP